MTTRARKNVLLQRLEVVVECFLRQVRILLICEYAVTTRRIEVLQIDAQQSNINSERGRPRAGLRIQTLARVDAR